MNEGPRWRCPECGEMSMVRHEWDATKGIADMGLYYVRCMKCWGPVYVRPSKGENE